MKPPRITDEHRVRRSQYRERALRTEIGAILEHLPEDDLKVLFDLAQRFRNFDLDGVPFDQDLPAVVVALDVSWVRCKGCDQANHPAGENRWVDPSGIHAEGTALRGWLAEEALRSDR